MKYIITGKNFTSPLFDGYKTKAGFVVMTEGRLQSSDICFGKKDKIYAPDETSVPIILGKIADEETRDKVDNIKNKYKCRLLLKSIYPDFYFERVTIDKLPFVKLPKNKKYVIKPQKGFFGAAVREIDSTTDLKKIAKELKKEIQKSSDFFSKDVFTKDDFLIEEFIGGEEYTFDVFYDEQGSPIIVNFCHHPMSKIKDYFHLLYYTCDKIYEKFSGQILKIFTHFNRTLGIKNLAVHAEFREKQGRLIPIEWNVPRFGGFGVADLPYYGYGIEPFEYFFAGKKPDWKKILKQHQGKYYGWVLCYNGIGINLEKHKPDYGKLKKDLGNVLHFYELDYKKNPAFGIAYVEKRSKEELNKLLAIDFRDYF